jgi:hypothetical protein
MPISRGCLGASGWCSINDDRDVTTESTEAHGSEYIHRRLCPFVERIPCGFVFSVLRLHPSPLDSTRADAAIYDVFVRSMVVAVQSMMVGVQSMGEHAFS